MSSIKTLLHYYCNILKTDKMNNVLNRNTFEVAYI